MAQPTSRFRVLSGILAVGQLGISLIVPILLFTGLGVYLTERFSVGAWLTVLCVIVGVVTAGCTFYRVAREFLARMRAEDKPRGGANDAAHADPIHTQKTNENQTTGAAAAPGHPAPGDAPTDHRHPGGDHT